MVFRKDSPDSVILCAACIIRSRMASASVGSLLNVCQSSRPHERCVALQTTAGCAYKVPTAPDDRRHCLMHKQARSCHSLSLPSVSDSDGDEPIGSCQAAPLRTYRDCGRARNGDLQGKPVRILIGPSAAVDSYGGSLARYVPDRPSWPVVHQSQGQTVPDCHIAPPAPAPCPADVRPSCYRGFVPSTCYCSFQW